MFYTLELNTLGLKMNSISIGAVGAAIIAGFFSIVSLIIGKEQKTSEFRQAWIDALVPFWKFTDECFGVA